MTIFLPRRHRRARAVPMNRKDGNELMFNTPSMSGMVRYSGTTVDVDLDVHNTARSSKNENCPLIKFWSQLRSLSYRRRIQPRRIIESNRGETGSVHEGVAGKWKEEEEEVPTMYVRFQCLLMV